MTTEQNLGTILIVDDSLINLLLLTEMLSESGYNLQNAHSGQEAIELINSELPDLVLLDINMPDINGYEVCSILKANEKTSSVPVIFLSALSEIDDKIQGFSVGGVDYITKPFTVEDVSVRVKTHIEISRLRASLEQKTQELQSKNDELQLEINEHETSLAKLSESYLKLEASRIAQLNLLEDLKLENELRRKNEEALREKEEKYRRVFETSGDSMFLIDVLSRNVIDANATACKIFGFELKDLIGIDFQLLSNEPEQTIQAIENEVSYVNIRWYKKKDGAVFPAEVFASYYIMDNKKTGVFNIRDITQRIASEKIIQNYASELEQKVATQTEQISTINKRLELAINAGSIAWWDWDYRSGNVIASSSKSEMLGYVDGELDSNVYSWTTLIHPDDYQFTMDIMRLALLSDEIMYDVEYRLRTKNGGWKWFHDSGKIVERTEDGKPVRIVGIVYDISNAKKSEEIIKENELKFRSLFENMIDGICILENVFDANQNIVDLICIDCNKAFEKQIIKNKEQVINQSIRSIFPKLDDETFKLFAQTGIDGNQFHDEYYIDDLELFFLISVYAPREHQVAMIFSDITIRKKAENELSRSEEKFRLISENMSDIVSLLDLQRKITYISPSVLELLGYTPQQSIGFSISQMIHPIDVSDFDAEFENLSNGVISTFIGQYRYKHASGDFLWMETNVKSILDESGQLQGFQATSHDITIKKKAEENLLQTLQKQTDLSELKSEFISIASHQFRTPLTTILSSVDILNMLMDSVAEAKQKQFEKHYARIADEVNRMTGLINDVLTISKIESGKITTFFEHANLVEFCKLLISSNFERTTDNRTVNFTVEGTPRDIFMDKKLMTHIITNLLSNAFKYSPKKGNPELKLNFTSQYLIITVTDEGIGIPPESKNNIFTSFFRAKNVNDFEGTGLGLVITKKFVELHRGTIDFTSEIGKLTTFQIVIPY